MCDEQQAEVAAVDLAKSPVVQGGNDGLTGPGRSDDQVAVPVVDRALGVELFQHLGLIWLRVHLQPGQRDGEPVGLRCFRRRSQAPSQTVAVLRRPVQLEFAALPVGVEGGAKLLQQMGVDTADSRTFHSRPSTSAAWDRLLDPT